MGMGEIWMEVRGILILLQFIWITLFHVLSHITSPSTQRGYLSLSDIAFERKSSEIVEYLADHYHVHLQIKGVCMWMCEWMCECVYVCVCVYVFACECVCVCVYFWLWTGVSVYQFFDYFFPHRSGGWTREILFLWQTSIPSRKHLPCGNVSERERREGEEGRERESLNLLF